MIYLMEFNKEGLDHYVNVNNFPISQIPLKKISQQTTSSQKIFLNVLGLFSCVKI